MKQKLISRLSMISVCALLCLCIACAKQDNASFSPYPIENLSSTISPSAQLSGFPDIASILDMKNTGNIQDTSTIEYTTHTTLTSPVAEEIQFYIEQPGSDRTKLHFIINGTDYALQHEELVSQFSDDNYIFCWAKCFLYDMDTADDMIEIAFQMNTFGWGRK